MSHVQKRSRVRVTVEATVPEVWALISDVTRVGEWSHECVAAAWLGGVDRAAPGVRFRGRNRAGLVRWTRINQILTVNPPHDIVWRTVPTAFFPDSTQWSIAVEASATGTLITQSFHVLRAPWLLDRIYSRLIPSHQDRDARLAEDLARIGEIAHRGVRAEARPGPPGITTTER